VSVCIALSACALPTGEKRKWRGSLHRRGGQWSDEASHWHTNAVFV